MIGSADLVAAIQQLFDVWHVPGGTVVVATPDGTVFEHAFGVREPIARAAASTDDLYEIGSISKVACSAVVLQLVDEAMLRLDSPVGELLPWARGTIFEDVTVLQLLQHTAGIVNGIDAVPDELGQALGYALHAKERGIEPAPSAVGRFHYSNLGYILLGLASARVTGTPYPRLLEQRVLQKAGMVASTPAVTHATRPRLAVGTQPLVDDRAWTPGDALTPAPFLEVAGADGCIAATGRDLAAFGSALLAADSAAGSPIISAGGFRAMTSMLAPDGEEVVRLEGASAITSSRYGLGVNVEDHDGSRVLTHGGGMVGYAAFLAVHLDARVVVAVVTSANGDGPVAEAIARYVSTVVTAGRAPALPDPARWAAVGSEELRPRAVEPGMTGDFRVGADRRASVRSVVLDGADERLEWVEDGESAALDWSWNGTVTTTHPRLRPYPLRFESGAWTWGPHRFVPATQDADEAAAPGAPDLEPFVGHYRSYTPWYTNFRMVLRAGDLILIAAPGVEAPPEEVVLRRVDGATFVTDSSSEHYAFGPVIDGRAAWVDRDGCRYSRAFTD